MLPKSFRQFETPRSWVLALNPLPRSPQKLKSINAPYIESTIHTFSLFVPISTRTRDPWLKKKIRMWAPGLAESDSVTLFVVLPVPWLPGNKTTRNFSSWLPYFPSVIYSSRESKTLPTLFIISSHVLHGVAILSVNIFRGDRGPPRDQVLPFAFFCIGLNFVIFAKKLTIFKNTFSKISL